MPSLDIKETFRFNIREAVKITTYSTDPSKWYAGIVLKSVADLNGVKYEVFFLNEKKQSLTYWFHEDELRKFDQAVERDNRIDQILS